MFTSTQTSTSTSIRPEIRFDVDYLKSINGLLKIGLLVNNLMIVHHDDTKSNFLGSWYHQRDLHGRHGPLGWCNRFLQLNYWSGMVVHSHHAYTVLLPCSWEVLHYSLASNWDRNHFNHHSYVLHRVSPSHPATRCCAYSRRGVRLYNYRSLCLFWIPEIQRLEKRWTCSRNSDEVNNNI